MGGLSYHSATGQGGIKTSIVATLLQVGSGLVDTLLAIGQVVEGFQQVRRFGLFAFDHFAVRLVRLLIRICSERIIFSSAILSTSGVSSG